VNKVLVPITDIEQIKVGSVIQERDLLRMVLKIEKTKVSQCKDYYVSFAVHISEVEQSPKGIMACEDLKKIQYLYTDQDFTYLDHKVKRVTFK
jgi:hypothetical protein